MSIGRSKDSTTKNTKDTKESEVGQELILRKRNLGASCRYGNGKPDSSFFVFFVFFVVQSFDFNV
jgi:hypothetical protein